MVLPDEMGVLPTILRKEEPLRKEEVLVVEDHPVVDRQGEGVGMVTMIMQMTNLTLRRKVLRKREENSTRVLSQKRRRMIQR